MMFAKTLRLSSLSLAILAGLSGCSSDDPANSAPVLNATATPASVEERSSATFAVDASDSDGNIESIQWQQTTGPAVDFSVNGQQITFVAPEVSADTAIGFDVSARDNSGATTTLALASTIINVNRAPVLAATPLETEFNHAIEFTLAATDPDGDALSAEIISPPSNGTLTALTGLSYRYTPATNSIAADAITIAISDGELSTSAVIAIAVIDSSAPQAVSVTPASSDVRVPLDSPITVQFDDIMLADSFSNRGNDCSGAIQVSMDNFTQCVAISSATLQTDQQTLELSLNAPLQADALYQIKLTEQARNFHGVAAEPALIGSIRTESADLHITEVSASRYYSDNRWVEIYNGTSRVLDLADYAIRSGSINEDNNSINDVASFALTSKTIAPGAYMVLQGRYWDGFWQSSVADSPSLLLIGDEEQRVRPAWWADSYVELTDSDNTRTIDFVRWGSSTQAPLTAAAWPHADNAVQLEELLGKSLVRDLSKADSNSASDWRYAQFITPAGDNDIDCSDDLDQDNIPDCAETEGATFAGLPLYEWGARTGVKDIFIEVDYMESTDPGITPHRRALERVVEAFAEHNVAVHFDAGNLFHNEDGLSPADFDLGGGNQVDFYPQTTFVSSAGSPSILDHKAQNFALQRRPIFHYLLMANSQLADGSAGSSGFAEIYGNDLMVSMGNWGFTMEEESARNSTINMQASTIMHELGHNLGLRHGGDVNTNAKPNHLSIMNYLYQLNGLPELGEHEADRYFVYFHHGIAACNPDDIELINGPTVAPAQFNMSYSSGLLPSIDEALVDESRGLGHDNSDYVDFNCNGVAGEMLTNYDVNFDGNSTDQLHDVDEWSRIDLQFSHYWSGNVSGSSQSRHRSNALKSQDIMANDRQALIEEAAPSAQLLQMIRALAHHD
ncbi:Ig-like domain-containing protein [uncultured Ferrimonas sp.]|uniref:Ig-like domain-containing protein n=1 Tax=uncultured Ferrimonas sp. TaxID=432640 RepID=UPI0026169BA5|nr:Ig-like domain-containing protein [uncultured Ferrimonas sp.]